MEKQEKLWSMLIGYILTNQDFADRLIYIHESGSNLIDNDKGNFIIVPVIGENGWESQKQYDKEKLCLMPYKNKLIVALKRLREDLENENN